MLVWEGGWEWKEGRAGGERGAIGWDQGWD